MIAIKVITTQSSAPRMLREADILKQASHLKENTCIMPIISLFSGEKAGYVGIVQPYVPHLPFESYYSDLDNSEVTAYMVNLLTALKTVHSLGFVHRDIKPANFIFIPKYKSGYLIDFGLAEHKPIEKPKLTRQKSSTMLQRTESAMCDCDRFHDKLCVHCWSRLKNKVERSGTPGYRSPEILQKAETQGPPIDLWAAGCILIQILSKKAPFFPPSKDDIQGTSQPSHHDNLDNDAICFSDQLRFIGIQAMENAMKEMKLSLKFNDFDRADQRLNFKYTPDYIKNECEKLSRAISSENDSENELMTEESQKSTIAPYSDDLYTLLHSLLQPSYSSRISAEKALLLLNKQQNKQQDNQQNKPQNKPQDKQLQKKQNL